jgi:hypothetical protein
VRTSFHLRRFFLGGGRSALETLGFESEYPYRL